MSQSSEPFLTGIFHDSLDLSSFHVYAQAAHLHGTYPLPPAPFACIHATPTPTPIPEATNIALACDYFLIMLLTFHINAVQNIGCFQ